MRKTIPLRCVVFCFCAALFTGQAFAVPPGKNPPPMPRSPPSAGAEVAARGVLQRLLGNRSQNVILEYRPEMAVEGRDSFEYEAHQGILTVRGTGAVALCRGFYEYLRAQGLGMVSWSGTRLQAPAAWPDAEKTRVQSPYPFRFYLNVVTYGYTMPYWTWPRWERELDWMALHGVNFPLALVATEAISERVWKKLGLTQQETDEFFTGPAHLPWNRMGNITRLDGPLPKGWHEDQVAMQHKILDRMHALGMEPIVPGFAGFVPRGLKRIYPEVKLHELAWGGMSADRHAFILSPDQALFQKIGRMFIEEWEKEFGPGRYYLADSFNEMELPASGQSAAELLAGYSRAIYGAIHAANPNAIWVLQGWMFGYQRQIWSKENVRALLDAVPDDALLILDEACDYNGTVWHNGMNWAQYDGWRGKPWVYGVIPNMGGKTAYTGVLDFYAGDIFRALKSPDRGRLTGYGFAPEGIENNEVLYELMSDLAWKTDPVNLEDWLSKYSRCRYGGYPDAMKSAWEKFRKSCYSSLIDHPGCGWQTGAIGPGPIQRGPEFFEGVQAFLSCAESLKTSPLYRGDAIEQAALALGIKADDWFLHARRAHEAGDGPVCDQALRRALELLTEADRLLESHPMHRLQRWIDFARAHGADEAQCRYYESNARRIITVWGPPIQDYSRRLWSGLIRDFYRERMRLIFEGLKTGKKFDRAAWEETWVRASGVSAVTPYKDPIAAASQLVARVCSEPLPPIRSTAAPPQGEKSKKPGA